MPSPASKPFTITGPDPDGDIIITVFPGTPEETDIHVEQDPDGEPITVDDVSFDPVTGELVVRKGDREESYDLGFLVGGGARQK